jgi:hypothetical protein
MPWTYNSVDLLNLKIVLLVLRMAMSHFSLIEQQYAHNVRHLTAHKFNTVLLIIFSNTNILYCFHGAFELTLYVSHKIRFSL